MSDVWLIVISFLYIFGVIWIAGFLKQKHEKEISRKFIHILVGNWVFILYFYQNLWAALVVPGIFVVINALSLKYNLVSSMERNDGSFGTVYYAITLCIIVLVRFMTPWEIFPLISVLIMAYGDGLAAILGKKYGKRKPFFFAPEKSMLGSVVIAVVAFLVTFFVLLLLGEKSVLERNGIGIILLISFITAMLSVFVEASGKRGCDNLTLPISAGLFATLAFYYGSLGFYLYFIFTSMILFVSLKMRLLTADGVVAAIMTAVTLYLLGGVWIALSLHGFYILGSAVSKIKNERKRIASMLQESSGARTWVQVVCNSLPASILVWFKYFFPQYSIFSLLAFAVFSAAAADTFSSELGVLSRAHVFNIMTGKRMTRGLSGGVSIPGLVAGFWGSFLLSWFAFVEFGIEGVLFVTFIGFSGTVIDSILGSVLQRKYLLENGTLSDEREYKHQKPYSGFKLISNNSVNLLSLFLVAILGHLVNLFYQIV